MSAASLPSLLLLCAPENTLGVLKGLGRATARQVAWTISAQPGPPSIVLSSKKGGEGAQGSLLLAQEQAEHQPAHGKWWVPSCVLCCVFLLSSTSLTKAFLSQPTHFLAFILPFLLPCPTLAVWCVAGVSPQQPCSHMHWPCSEQANQRAAAGAGEKLPLSLHNSWSSQSPV